MNYTVITYYRSINLMIFIAPLLFSCVCNAFFINQLLSVNHVISFGDQFSDKGNYHNLTKGVKPNPKYYKGGRFSDGFLWDEELAIRLNAHQHNYAYAYATSDNDLFDLPGCIQQVSNYLNDLRDKKLFINKGEKVLATMAFLERDLAHGKLDPQDTVDSQEECLEMLVESGRVNHVLIATSFAPELFPGFMKTDKKVSKNRLHKKEAQDKEKLRHEILSYYEKRAELWSLLIVNFRENRPGIQFYEFDLRDVLYKIHDGTSEFLSPSQSLLHDAPCLQGTITSTGFEPNSFCYDISKRMFWDPNSLSMRVHSIIGRAASKSIENYIMAH